MIYFDTDVLIHMLVCQDPEKHELANSLYKEAVRNQQFFISLLCLQEASYVLYRLGYQVRDIEDAINAFIRFNPVSYEVSDMKRGIHLARIVGFKHINDCIHLSIAENYCSQICTFNKADFQRLNEFTSLKIKIV